MIADNPTAPFILLDDARPAAGAHARLYCAPDEIVAAYSVGEVEAALDRLTALHRAGAYLAGFIAYEAGCAFEPRLRTLPPPADGSPLLWFGAFAGFETIAGQSVPARLPDPGPARAGPIAPIISQHEYAAAFDSVKRYIRDGDIYQANLTFRATVSLSGSMPALYAAIRPQAEAGHGALMFTGSDWHLSFSPEAFFALEDGKLSARPMKGTALRGGDPDADARAIDLLRNDPKQRAENLMIVDLLRNDLSRVSKAGTVRVPQLFHVETYPTVHQMVSQVEAQLLPGLSAFDVLRRLFPCGSITGAPKMRAIEIIRQLEAGPRGLYTGSIGHVDPSGDAAFNVAIRTVSVKKDANTGLIGLGSGIVADSECQAEWAECFDKGRFLNPVG